VSLKYVWSLLVSLQLASATARADSARDLNEFEKNLLSGHEHDLDVFPRENIVLMWPKNARPDWYAESPVASPAHLADWLERVYETQREWTSYDPNAYYSTTLGVPYRLVYIANGAGDFVFGGVPRPYIGLREVFAETTGSEDWFGWLTHETSHDFWHEHPDFKRVKEEWGEGMCDYSRLFLLGATGMPKAAEHWRAILERADDHDRYRGRARMLLDFQLAQGLSGPADLWSFLRDKDFAIVNRLRPRAR
jgi:hypothetical protein